MTLSAAASSPGVWQVLVAGGLGSLIGGLFSLAGAYFAQKAARDKDKTERKARWDREDQLAQRELRRRFLIDVAEAVEERKSWLRRVSYGIEHETASLDAPRFQLIGRIETFGSPPINYLWHSLTRKIFEIQMEIQVGNRHLDRSTGNTELSDQDLAPAAVAIGDVLITLLAIMLITGSDQVDAEVFIVKLRARKGRSSYDNRHRDALDMIIAEIEEPSSLWQRSWLTPVRHSGGKDVEKRMTP